MKIADWNVFPDSPISGTMDPSNRLVQLAQFGYSQLAADTILLIENQGKLVSVVQASIDLLDELFRNDAAGRKNCVQVLLEVALNLLGLERKRAGFSDLESIEAIHFIAIALRSWEMNGGSESIRKAVEEMLNGMKLVLSGKGMVAKMAEEIEKALLPDNFASSFIEASRLGIQKNVYYQIVDTGLSKFGNDSATGLRWARHLGAVQVSSNPVIAARAFDEISELWKKFETVGMGHPEWAKDPELFADEIALFGTVVSLLPNILDFRPIALLSDFKDGMVSIQLNPQKAGSADGSVKDALKFHSILSEILEEYDVFLTGNRSQKKARPNIVFKVSTVGPEAVALTERLDSLGIGTNNTVTFSIGQEIKMTLVAMRGLAAALKAGTPITTIYMTNMEGRLEDHLREIQGAKVLSDYLVGQADEEGALNSIAQKIGAQEDVKRASFVKEQQIKVLASKKYLKSLADDWFVSVIGEEKRGSLRQMEDDIRMSGIYVTRRVFQILYDPEVKSKLVQYITESSDISEEDAARVVEAVNLLPASKRRAEDTILVLADSNVSNLTNTEFPDHQLKVLQKSREPGFKLPEYEDSIKEMSDPAVLKRLLEIEDFRKVYETNSNLVAELSKIGIGVPLENEGMEPEEWSSFGPVLKTMDEFNNAYLSFRSRLVSSIAKSTIERPREITARAKAD